MTRQLRSTSLWDTLPIEIKSYIISKCDSFTRYLNNDITDEELEQNGNEIWNIVFQMDLVDFDLKLLRLHYLPKIYNGLALVRSEQMYQNLCQLKPDLFDTGSLEKYLIDEYCWDYWTTASFEILIYTDCYQGLVDLSDRLIHIPLRRLWVHCFPEWFQNMDWSRLFTVACHFGHVEFARYLLKGVDNYDDASDFLRDVGLACLELAVNSGHGDIVRLLISFKSYYTGEKCKSALKRACEKGSSEIISTLYTAFDPSGLEIELNKIFRTLCLAYNSGEMVGRLCNMEQVTSKLNGNWKIDGIVNGVVNGGGVGTISVLIETLEPWEWVGACEAALNVAVGGNSVRMHSGPFFYSSLNPGKVLELFQGVDVGAVRRMAVSEGHVKVVEFLDGLVQS
ncbi:hypothetical protein HDU76_006911 [Blyttiomyces sp. JEL0837]|nr:hypothetical protein HDU76_006911 [Blyttiomyces sp. JEL0837]